jgi:predicted dehydrogenase
MSGPGVAVIGLGFMGSRWARALADHHGAQLAVVSDVDVGRGTSLADTLAARFDPDPVSAAARAEVEAVVVCTPEHLHVEVALAALKAGKALAVEKPLAHTVAAAERIRDAATTAGLPVLAAHVLRFEPRYAAMRSAIAADEIGRVQAIRSERIGLTADQDILRGRTSIALYYGVHEFDLARWYAGPIDTVWAASSTGVLRTQGHDVEDLYSVGLRFSSGAHGTAMLGWSLPPRTPGFGIAGFTVIGEHGVLQVAQGTNGLLKVHADGAVDTDVHYAPRVHGHLYGALGIEVDHFVRCVRSEAEPVCTASDGVEAVRAALAVERAAASGTPVIVSDGAEERP